MDFDWTQREKEIVTKLSERLMPRLKTFQGSLLAPSLEEVKQNILSCFEDIGICNYSYLTLEKETIGPFGILLKETVASLSLPLYFSLELGNLLFSKLISFLTISLSQDNLVKLKNLEQIASVAIKDNTNGNKIRFISNIAYTDWLLIVNLTENLTFWLINVHSNYRDIPCYVAQAPFGPVFGHLDISILEKETPLYIEANREEFLRSAVKVKDEVLLGAALGIMKTAFESARDFSKTKIRNGKPLIAFQHVGFKLAEMLTLWDAARHLAYRYGWQEEVKDKESEVLLCCAKAFCVESAERLSSEAMQITGLQSFEEDNQLKDLYLFSKFLSTLGTPTEEARLRIGDLLLERF